MAIGLGHTYWVEVKSHHYGTLQDCLLWLSKQNYKINEWVELHPHPNLKEAKCEYYTIDIVKLDRTTKKKGKKCN